MTSCAIPEELFAAIKEIVSPEEMEEAVFTDDKTGQRRKYPSRSKTSWQKHLQKMKNGLALIDEAVYQYQKKTVRKMILKDHKRPDGRAINQIRPLSAEIDLLPQSTWFWYVYPWSDTDLYSDNTCTYV